jgi:hypothetical protein
MAINAPVLELLLKLAAQTRSKKRLICFGYPDMLVTNAQLAKLCGSDIHNRVQFREDSDSILRWHNLAGQIERVVETKNLFSALGIDADFLDIHASRGVEIVGDLNEPVQAELVGRYDLVYDGGTMEHCFNVGQVMRNIIALGKVGAYIVHINPINYYNHGFFNFSPTFYYDFYSQSGNRVVSDFYGVYGPVLNSQMITLPPLQGFSSVPERMTVMMAAQKLVDKEPSWPLQSKYRANPGLKS